MTTTPLTRHRVGGRVPDLGAERLQRSLQVVAGHLVELKLHGPQAHGVAFGICRPEVALWLAGIAQTARAASASVAERIRTLDAPSGMRMASTSTTATPPDPPGGESSIAASVKMISRHAFAVVGAIRGVPDRIGADVPAADLLRAITGTLEMQAWLLHSGNDET